MNASIHPDREELAAYVLGTLPEDRAERLEEHLAACPACEETIRGMEGLSDPLIQGLRRAGPKATVPPTPILPAARQTPGNRPAVDFDPYHRWLGIPPKDQPPNHYRLLAIEVFEADPEVIADAVDRQMAHVRTYHLGPQADLSQKILNEIAAAKVCLLNPKKKAAYDTQLRQQLPKAQPPQQKLNRSGALVTRGWTSSSSTWPRAG